MWGTKECALKRKETAYGSGRYLCRLRSDECPRGNGHNRVRLSSLRALCRAVHGRWRLQCLLRGGEYGRPGGGQRIRLVKSWSNGGRHGPAEVLRKLPSLHKRGA